MGDGLIFGHFVQFFFMEAKNNKSCISKYLKMASLNIKCSLLRAGVQSTLDPSTETLCRSSALAQERKGLDCCMRVYM